MGYSKHIYQRVWEILDGRKQAAREQAVRHREEIHQKIPRIAELERQMARQAAHITRIVVAGSPDVEEKMRELAQANLAVQQERAALLTQHGYPPDYLTLRHFCSHCRDTGYVEQTMCHCMKALLRQEAAAQLSRVSPVGSSTFESFSLDYYPDIPDESGISPRARMKDVLSTCRHWTDTFSPTSESLLLIGKTGLGKTHLSVAMASCITQAGYGVVYTSVQRMMDMLEAEKFSREATSKEQYRDTMVTYLDCDLLVLDDLGTEFMNQFTGAALFNILNSRLVEERPTIISTNLELAEIEARYSQRMLSRLVCAYQVLRFAGKDIRYQKKVGGIRPSP
jgi:DNA replication protein DnaC